MGQKDTAIKSAETDELAQKLDIKKVNTKDIGKTPEGTVDSIKIQKQKNSKKTLWYMLAVSFFGAGVAFVSFFMITHMKNYIITLGLPGDQAQSLFYLTAAIGITVYLISAVVGGAFSDDIRTRFGNRVPMILGGAIFAGLMYILTPFIVNLSNVSLTLPIIYSLINLGVGIAVSPQYSLLSELFDREERGTAALILAIMSSAGTAIGIFILTVPLIPTTSDYNLLWMLCGIGIIIFGTMTFLFTPKTNPGFPPDGTLKDVINTPKYLLTIGGGDMWKMFLVQIIWGTANYTISLSYSNYLQDVLGKTNITSVNLVFLTLGIAGALAAVPVGITIQLIGKVKGAITGTAIFAIFAFFLSVTSGWQANNSNLLIMVILAVIGGLGTMFITTVTVALPSDLVPKGKEAQLFGAYILANGIAQPIFLIVVSSLNWGFGTIFIADAGLLILGCVILFGIQYEKMIDSEYKRFYERYLALKGFVLDTLESAVDKLAEQIDFARIK